MWEFKFAKAVLAQLIGPIDDECRDILNGKVFVTSAPFRDFPEYFAWLTGRPENLIRMVEVAQKLILEDMIKSLESTESAPAEPKKILASCIAIQRLYREALNFERATLEIQPPNQCEALHSLQVGWTQPIREGILELFKHLHTISELPLDTDSHCRITFTFGEVPHLKEFLDEMDRLSSFAPQLFAKA